MGALLQVTVDELKALSHEVRVSDLYAMQWNCKIDHAARLRVGYASGEADMTNTLTEDVKHEQEKLLWADTVIFHFPIWWYSMASMLKSWPERVYLLGFRYGLGQYSGKRWGERYGEGKTLGKRAMLTITVGGWTDHYSRRGICGPMDALLFPVDHGLLYYTGFDVLPPFIFFNSDKVDEVSFETGANELRQRLRALSVTKPIAYRPQNGGDYEMPALTLKPEVESSSTWDSLSLHIRETKDTDTAHE